MITIMRIIERGTTTAMVIGGVLAASVAFTDGSTGDIVSGELVVVSGELVSCCSGVVVSGELVSGGSGVVVSGELVSGSSSVVELKMASGEQVKL